MKKVLLSIVLAMFGCAVMPAQNSVELKPSEKTLNTQWFGKRVAYLGDSMTDSTTVNGMSLYWRYLQELLGVEPFVYGINGNQWDGIYKQSERLLGERGDAIDAIMILAGTNDYNHGLPIGKFFEEAEEQVIADGRLVVRHHRTPIMCDSTFCGRINKVLFFLKDKYPSKQIIMLTPIHRGYAKFGDKNIQPDEYYCNSRGLYLETYVEVLKQAAAYWSIPVIDLYSVCGILPNMDSATPYVNKEKTDRLHPSTLGHYRIAKTIQYQLVTLPAETY